MKRRMVYEWLLLFLWIEVTIICYVNAWVWELRWLIVKTNLLRPMQLPGESWEGQIFNVSLLLIGIGVGLWWTRWYGVMVALIIILLTMIALGYFGIAI